MRRALPNHSKGRCPLALRAHPLDIWEQKKSGDVRILLFLNIPAGGFYLGNPRTLAGQSTQNSSFKNFRPSGVRR